MLPGESKRTFERRLTTPFQQIRIGAFWSISTSRHSPVIRRCTEYSWLPDDRFTAGRISFLRSLLARRRIYATDRFLARNEGKARANLDNELTVLLGRQADPS